MFNKFKNYINDSKFKVYGLTQNITTNEYMLILDTFSSKRDKQKGKCMYCTWYNTSPAWCQTCDPQKTSQGWTSGNKNIDDCIKEFQLKSTEYENVIEWIPFNRLDNIQNNGDKLLATWLDGIRVALYVGGKKKYTQSHTPSCIVDLKILSSSQNLTNLLIEVREIL